MGSAIAVLTATVVVTQLNVQASAQARPTAAGVRIDPDDIGGVVTSSKGPEAGVWVIAETTNLPTKFHKLVVTDDQGRFVIPDLPRATYKVWVRGYGLVDSTAVSTTPGKSLNLTATIAPTPRDAAQYYPASYWLSLMEIPDASQFPGTGPEGNGIGKNMEFQASFIGQFKNACMLCHQMGNKATREIPKEFGFGTGAAAWDRRVQSGQRGAAMSGGLNQFGRAKVLQLLGDWTDRIAAGEFPQEVPPRPAGIERNLVVSFWAWRGEKGNIHDMVSTDKRKPTVNPNGKIYGVDLMSDILGWVDPVENKAGNIKIPVRDADTPSFAAQTMPAASPYWGEEVFWKSPANMHNPMIDGTGRVWLTSSLRPATRQPAWCKDPNNPFAKYFPLESSSRQASFYDPKVDKTTLIDVCYGTHHLQFAEDKDNTLYFSGGGDVIGWLNTNMWDATKSDEKSQGWCPLIVDTNGNGKIDPGWTEPGQPKDPAKDMRVRGGSYGIIPNPVDGSIWWAYPGVPGWIMRLEIGNNPPATCKTEVYAPPFDKNSKELQTNGYDPRGIDIGRDGVIWTALAGTGAGASFDRSKCKTLIGPTATGDHCREGWMLYQTPSGPRFRNLKDVPTTADHHYYNWVDQFDTIGLGKNLPVMNGTNSDALYVLMPDRKWVTMRVSYPLTGMFSKGVDGRIDDPKTGWKGMGWYANTALVPVWHLEGGKGTAGGVYHFQMRPDPLAR
jgi:hypothetical protein